MRASAKKELPGSALTAGTALLLCLSAAFPSTAQQTSAKDAPPATAAPAAPAKAASDRKTFDTPDQAVDTLIAAAEQFDTPTLIRIFGPRGDEVVMTGDFVQDRQRASDFVAEAHEKKSITVDPKNPRLAYLLVGKEDWPLPIPLVKLGNKWRFDTEAGLQEMLYRRIGANELDAIHICNGYVDAQQEYALKPREGYAVAQYAQRIISTPGKQDGLAWKNDDGTWGGPIGENIAKAIAEGYTSREEPYHGYFFKVLKGQGPDAPIGQLNYVIDGVMIGGFALVAAPAEYRVTGAKTFMVSNDGVVYEKDFGPTTLDEFKKIELFNPDKSWTPVEDDEN